MYSLRVITKLGNEIDYYLGSRYFTYYRECSDKEIFKNHTDNVYAIVCSESGMKHPLLKDDSNYIINLTGDTYRNITFRGAKKKKAVNALSDEELINEMHTLYANAGIDREYEMFYVPAERNLRSALGLKVPNDLVQNSDAQRIYAKNF